MYEGLYKYDRSADFLGYQNAIPSLKKAFDLINKEYGRNFTTIFATGQNYVNNAQRFEDLFKISNALKECYDNTERPDLLMDVLDKISKYNFPMDYFGIFYQKAWTYHRNRFFTSAKFPFLKNSVEENEQEAFAWCYKGLQHARENSSQAAMFGMSEEQAKLQIYHYLAILYAYNKKYDSSEYCYEQREMYGAASYNNWGGLKGEIGEFAKSYDYFSRGMYEGLGTHWLREPYYYIPISQVYSNKTKEAIAMAEGIITERMAAPGFGWYNLALARAFLYDGQLDSCEYALNKAAGFKEVHIGTTLTQTQYDFTINLLRYQLTEKKISAIKFLNKGWWHSPGDLYNIGALTINKAVSQYVLINQMTYNPERSRLIYDLFCSESTTTFDEAWSLIKDFSHNYFTKMYEGYQQKDSRKNLQRYFRLFTGLFQLQGGDDDEAQTTLENVVRESVVDANYEKLFLARLYEGLSNVYDENNVDDKAAFYKTALLNVYPQLWPYSGLKGKFSLAFDGDKTDPVINSVWKEIKQANVDWRESGEQVNGVVSISITKRGSRYEASYSSSSADAKKIVSGSKMVFSTAAQAGSELVLRCFGKGGGLVFEPPVKS